MRTAGEFHRGAAGDAMAIEFGELGLERAYPRGTILFVQGSPSNAVYFVETGQIKVSRAEEGGATVVIGFGGPGSLLGDTAAILRRPYIGTAQVVAPCSVRELDAVEFRRQVKFDSHFSWRIHEFQSRDIEEKAIKLASVGGLSTRRRLERFLADALAAQAGPLDGSPRRITPPIKHLDVAAAIFASPEHLCRLLKELENDGLIRRDRGWLVVLRPDLIGQAPMGEPLPTDAEIGNNRNRAPLE
jgi:CRP/FNR family transcriptional regulator